MLWEFLSLNADALNAYSNCESSEEVGRVQQEFMNEAAEYQREKDERRAHREEQSHQS